MRKVNKGAPLPSFTKFAKTKHGNDWEKLPSSVRRDCRLHIMRDEQDYICAYTELILTDNNSHIDHFKKRNLFRKLTFDWNNLIVAYSSENFGAKYKDNGDDKVTSATDYDKLINPVTEDPEHFFRYMIGGQIAAQLNLTDAEKQRANFTINTFCLNHPYLIDRRKELINTVINSLDGKLNEQTIKSCLKGLGFPSVVNYIFNSPLPISRNKG